MAGENRTRRNRSYWEPIYNPLDKEDFQIGATSDNHAGCKHVTLNSDGLKASRKFERDNFDTCNFVGLFESKVFNSCEFRLCDFGLSTWKFSKFSRCKFLKSSFTQTTFVNCEFRNCSWEDVGLSGNETNFHSTTVSNPRQLIAAAYTNLDSKILDEWKASRYYQRVRLQRTKANVARKLLNVLAVDGEESWYYEAIEVYACNVFLLLS